MPIKIPNALPATAQLQAENIFVMSERRATTQHIRPLRLILLNLMPLKIATENQILRKLSNTPLQVEVKFMRMASHQSKNTSAEHLEAFYTTFEEVRHQHFDGMIITGAPVEKMPFDDVNYWPELAEIMDWSQTNVHSTLHICWGAQAGLYYHYGIDKHLLPNKMTGIFDHKVVRPTSPLVRGFDGHFNAPHSRNTAVNVEDIERHPQLENIAFSEEAGAYLCKSRDNRNIFVFGHPEYDVNTLGDEYIRDLDKMGDDAPKPAHYYPNDDPEQAPIKTWNAHAQLLYSNWLNYYVYQTTPFDFSQVGKLHADLAEVTTDVGWFRITAEGSDKVGVVAVLAGALAELGVAIDTMNQKIVGGTFSLTFDVHVATDDSSWEDIQNAMSLVSKELGIRVKAFYPEN